MKLRKHKEGWGCVPYAPTRWVPPSRFGFGRITRWAYQVSDYGSPYAEIAIRIEDSGPPALSLTTEVPEHKIDPRRWAIRASDDLPPEFVEFMDTHFKREDV